MPDRKALSEAQLKVYERLKQVRASTTVTLEPSPLVRQKITTFDGRELDFAPRFYQVIGVFHMLVLKRMVLGDDTGLGKTCETILTLCSLWKKEPNNRVIVVAPKSAMRQWASEIERFTTGVKVFVASDIEQKKGEAPVEARKRLYEAWASAPASDHPVLILNYALLVRDWHFGGIQPPKKSGKLDPKKPVVPGLLDGITGKIGQNLVCVFDEAAAFKTMSTKTWEVVRFVSDRAHRVYGLTATLLKNNLMEGYCIYKAIKPDLFGTKTKFLDDYCHIKLQEVGRKRIPVVLGYKNLDHFRETIDPFFIGRKKHMVAKELPSLTTREVSFELTAAENTKYTEALNGILELGDGEVREFEETKALTSLIYCQQIVNSLAMLKFQEGSEIANYSLLNPFEADTHKVGALSSKEQAFVDLITGELDDEKVIVYTRFASLVPRLQEILKKSNIQSVRVTGKDNDKARQAAQAAFQDLTSKTRVIFITAAGSEAINLQAAVALVFFDAPWSFGDYLQTLGRMIRIGSPHQKVLAFHLLAERPMKESKTIDHHVVALLRKKQGFIDKVLGEGAVGALKFDKSDGGIKNLLRLMQGKASAA